MAGTGCCTLERILKKKTYGQYDHPQGGNLKRCLSVWDLTSLGVGSSLGVGVFVIIGTVASQLAGPSVVLSFVIAAVASVFAGLCYAELGCRVPRAGSTFIYTYIAIGELPAFILGWNMILEGFFGNLSAETAAKKTFRAMSDIPIILGSASLAKGLSLFIDDLSNNTVSSWSLSVTPINTGFFSPYFDLVAFLTVLILGVILITGVRQSSLINMLFVAISLAILVIIIIAGAVKADVNNWYLTNETVPSGFGEGGFFPYGGWGTLKGAAVCFYGFVGFESITSAAEEVKNRHNAIPKSIVSSIGALWLIYTTMSIVTTMVLPYYLQESVGSVVLMFQYIEWEWARWTASVGFISAILSSLFGSMFPVGRLLYAMAAENLAPNIFSRIHKGRKLPMFGILLSSSVIAVLSSVLDLDQMILMMCLGTLFSYTFVAISIIVLRYDSNFPIEFSVMKQLFGCGGHAPSRLSSIIVYVLLFLYVLTCVVAALIGVYLSYPLIPMAVIHIVAILLVLIMALQPMQKEDLYFKAPLVPLIPCLSIYFNINLMVLINWETWVRLLVWMIIGIFMYLSINCCNRNKAKDQESNEIYLKQNGNSSVQIIVESATPRISMQNNETVDEDEIKVQTEKKENILGEENNKENVDKSDSNTKEIVVKQAFVEHTEEKEAKIIDLLDQVLQAEEATYEDMSIEVNSINETTNNINKETVEKDDLQRKSFSEFSDAGSEASLSHQVLAKYDVIAEVHREDLPKVKEVEENDQIFSQGKQDENNQENTETEHYEIITEDQKDDENMNVNASFYIDSDTESKTDESGYSDTTDRNQLHESIEFKEEIKIPSPPPMNESLLASPIFKSYTISVRSPQKKTFEEKNEVTPRESVQSNESSDENIVFGSSRQRTFMTKLNDIFQNKKPLSSENSSPEIIRKRSNSIGNVVESSEIPVSPRPAFFLDLKQELLAKNNTILKSVKTDKVEETKENSEPIEETLTKEDLKSKLENLLASGGPKLLKPRPIHSNPPTPEDTQTDNSSEESIKLPKIEKNDTLSKQKAKFSEVLKSFRMSMNQDDSF